MCIRDSHGGAGRKRLREVASINRVHGREIAHALQEDGGLDHVRQVGAGRDQDGAQIAHHLFGLRGHVIADYLAAGWVESDLSGREDKVADANRL